MIDLAWISLLFLSLSWLGISKIYGEQPVLIYILIALILAGWSSFRASTARRSNFRSALRRAGVALLQCAVIFLFQGFVFLFAYWVFAKHHAENLFAALSGNLLSVFGVNSVVEGGDIYIFSALKTIAFSSSWEKVGLIFFLTALAGGYALLALKGAGVKKYLCLLAVTAAYSFFRYTLLLLLYASYQFHSLFWVSSVTLLTLLPYSIILARVFRGLPEVRIERIFLFRRGSVTLVAAALAFTFVFSSAAFLGWHDLGREKNGRVMVEEYHSNWEWTDEAYDENWFGERSGYNYYCFYEYISKFYHASRNTAHINRESLENVDVLILKTPTEPYSNDEISAILDFVANGGGLYMIGDHTNVFGTGSNLNQIAPDFGFSFNYDCTYELTSGSLSEYDAPRLLPHPVVAGLPHFLFATSCTLETSWLTEEIITGYGLKNLPADYSQDNFFPADTNSGLLEFGSFVQCASAYYGKGRVLAFTDSTVYSNFWMHMPGKPELLLKSLQWLNRENTMPIAPRAIAAAIALLSFTALAAFVVFTARKSKKNPSAPVILTSGVAAFFISAVLFGLHAHSLKLPEPIAPIVNICFEDEYSTAMLPKDLEGFLADMDEQISTFYVWTQRLGYVPSLQRSLEEAMDKGDMAVIVKPDKPLRNIDGIMDKIEEGAVLLILDNVSGGYANDLLERAGMAISAENMAEYADFRELKDIPLTENVAAVLGGETVIVDANGNAVLSVKNIGKGKLAVFSDPDLFFNKELGDISSNLTDKTRILTKVEFNMMRELLASQN
ncbi:MAG: GldG family protein [Syntrophomonadaceae bacterium]|jgi:hypothetical protein|nr:GldG family protein [Syntrophomonadaceae bacterium]